MINGKIFLISHWNILTTLIAYCLQEYTRDIKELETTNDICKVKYCKGCEVMIVCNFWRSNGEKRCGNQTRKIEGNLPEEIHIVTLIEIQ